MIRLCLLVLGLWLTCLGAASAQDDDKGFLTNLLQDSLAGDGRDVQINGFRGALSSEATIETITIADDDGIWLTMRDLVLRWNRSALLRGRIDIERVSAASIELARTPKPVDDRMPEAEARDFKLPELPVSIDIEALEVAEIILGAPVLGEEMRLTFAASASLADGSGRANLTANRIDGQDGQFEIDAAFEDQTQIVDLKINLSEGPAGIAARLIDLPGRPATTLQIEGNGPLDDFVTDIAIATDGRDRLTGQVRLIAEAEQGAKPARRFEANLGGDVTALFAPQYQAFFGHDVALELAGRRAADGSLDLSRLAISAEALTLNGSAVLNPDFWPERIDLDGTLAADDAVLLPLPGAETRVDRADISVQFDRAVSDRWTSKLRIQGLDRNEIKIGDLRLIAGGDLARDVGALGRVTANVDFEAEALDPTDPALAAALGSAVDGSMQISYLEGEPVEIRQIDLNTVSANLTGEATISALGTGFETDLDARLITQDLSRFSQLAGREIAGSAELEVDGQVALGGKFDLRVDGRTDDLRVGQEQADKVLRGTTSVSIVARRDTTGTVLEAAKINNEQIDLTANGRFATDDSEVQLALTLAEFAEIEPRLPGSLNVSGNATQNASGWSVDLAADGPIGSTATVAGRATGPQARLNVTASVPDIRPLVRNYSGPLKLDGVVAQSDEGWTVETEIDGPYGLTADLSGRVTGDSPALRYTARLPDIRPFVPQLGGPLSLNGTARQQAENWQIDTNLTGPAGTTAKVTGTATNAGLLDLDITGNAPLGLSEPFLKPRSLQGDARFDLRLNGQPSLEALSGTISTNNGRFSAPNFQLALTQISATASINNGRVGVDLDAAVSSGGRVAIRGPVTLTGAMPAALTVSLSDVRLADPTLYETILNGAVEIRGNLQGGAQIAGQIDVGETNIIVPSSGVSGFGIIPEIVHVGASREVRRTQARAGIGQSSTANSRSGPVYGLNILINAPSRIFVRGRGIDAELGGRVRLTGTTANVISAGRFDLVRGRLDVLEKRFQLDEGSIQLQGDFDPFIRFLAQTRTGNGTASVIIEGRVSSPEVRFESSPDAPQDEILAQIFFRRDVSQLSAFQALQLANAVATLAGRGGESIVSRLRRSFNLDDLDVTTDDEGNTALRVGKYLTDNIYTDVTTGTDGSAEVSLNIDLTPSLKARGSIGQDGESGIGIYFERDY